MARILDIRSACAGGWHASEMRQSAWRGVIESELDRVRPYRS